MVHVLSFKDALESLLSSVPAISSLLELLVGSLACIIAAQVDWSSVALPYVAFSSHVSQKCRKSRKCHA
jgi:hypothetical protein